MNRLIETIILGKTKKNGQEEQIIREEVIGADPGRGSARGRTGQEATQGTLVESESGVEGVGSVNKPIPGLPSNSPGPNDAVIAIKKKYMAARGMPYRRQAEYVKVDPAFGKRLADAYEALKHDPSEPSVLASYRALANETIAQFNALLDNGFTFNIVRPGMTDPYAAGPKAILADLMKKHLWIFATEGDSSGNDVKGLGGLKGASTFKEKDNVLLEKTPFTIDGYNLVVNDAFRAVHDVFGHGPEGVGFGPHGEENSWQSHVRMFSPLAARAMTSETRGQNSWVNWGPYGEANQHDQRHTHYADQKNGLMPEWTSTERVDDDNSSETIPPVPTVTDQPINYQQLSGYSLGQYKRYGDQKAAQEEERRKRIGHNVYHFIKKFKR